MSADSVATFDENTTPEDYIAAIESSGVQGVTNYTTIVGFPPGAIATVMESDDFIVSSNPNLFNDWVDGLGDKTLKLVSDGISDAFKTAASPDANARTDLTAERGVESTVTLA